MTMPMYFNISMEQSLPMATQQDMELQRLQVLYPYLYALQTQRAKLYKQLHQAQVDQN